MTSTTSPQLLYHNPRAVPYPTNDTNASTTLLAVRFASPVRVSSVRIAPEGVRSVDGIGCTYPSTWSGKIYLNTSTASPVNALLCSRIEYKASEWERDYPIGMPEGVTTRLLILESPAERIALSIYGYSASDSPSSSGNLDTAQTSGVASAATDKEDWSWFFSWAGGSNQLCALLRPTTDTGTLGMAEDCLDLLVDVDPTVLSTLAADDEALEYLRQATSPVGRSLWRCMRLDQPVDPDSPHSSTVKSRDAEKGALVDAWRRFEEDHALLIILARSKAIAEDLLAISSGHQHSNVSRLLSLASTLADRSDIQSKVGLETILDILHSPPDNPIIVSHLATRLPRLFVISRLRGSNRLLPFDSTYARRLVKALFLISTEVIHGQSCWTVAQELAGPYLSSLDPTDPLRAAFETSTPAQSTLPASDFTSTENGRRLARFDHALTSSNSESKSSGIVHSLSPAELLSILAPAHYASLRSARLPPLGIPALSPTSPLAQGQTQASTFGGKVYSLHEFRRERDTGLGGSGLGAGAGGRPASKHVDDFAMA